MSQKSKVTKEQQLAIGTDTMSQKSKVTKEQQLAVGIDTTSQKSEVTKEQQLAVRIDTTSQKSEVTKEQQLAVGIDTPSQKSEVAIEEQVQTNGENDFMETLIKRTASLQPLHNSSSYCQTRCETSTIEFTWKIDRCPVFLKIVKQLMSPSFPETAKYKIKVEVSRASEWLESDVKFYLVTEAPFNGTCMVYMIKIDNTHTIIAPSVSTWGIMSDMTLLYDTKIRNLCDYMYRDTAMLKFTFEIFHQHSVDILHVQSLSLTKICPTSLKSTDLTDNSLGDIFTFLVNGERYNISKKILHKTKFVEYFCNTYKENMANNLITISVNISMQEIFKILFSYVKTGCLIPKQLGISKAQTLLEIATKCDLRYLKFICEMYLIRTISISSALELFQYAILHNAKYLEQHAASFIKFHTEDIVCTDEFKSLSQEQLNKIIKSVEKIEIIKECEKF